MALACFGIFQDRCAAGAILGPDSRRFAHHLALKRQCAIGHNPGQPEGWTRSLFVSDDTGISEAPDVRFEVARKIGPVPCAGALPGLKVPDYRVLADYEAELKELEKKNPDLVKVFEMKRPSLEGRTVFGAEIAADVKDVAADGRPIFYVDGVHHAREWPAAEYPMIFAYHLIENFGKDPKLVHGTVHGPGYAGAAGITASHEAVATGMFAASPRRRRSITSASCASRRMRPK